MGRSTRAAASILGSGEVVIGRRSSLRQQIRLISCEGFTEVKAAAERSRRGGAVSTRRRRRLIKHEFRGFS